MERTRRALVKGGGLALLSLSLGGIPPFLWRAARAAGDPLSHGRRRVLVTIFQRGAMDGLMAVTPIDDPALAEARPNLFMSLRDTENGLTDLDGRFALHPAFAALAPLYEEGRLAIVHGVGSTYKTRSHFDAQDYMETGTPGVKGTASGWLNRAAGLLGRGGSPARSVALADKLPRSLYGDRPAIAVDDLQSFGIRVPADLQASERLRAGFASMYAGSGKRLVRRVGKESFEAVEVLRKANWREYQPADGAVLSRVGTGSQNAAGGHAHQIGGGARGGLYRDSRLGYPREARDGDPALFRTGPRTCPWQWRLSGPIWARTRTTSCC